MLNHTSELFKVESYHDDGYEMVEFNKGELVNKARKKIQHQHGTTVTWKLDNDVYPVITYELEELKSIILNFAGVSNKIKFVFYVGGELVDEYSYSDLSVFADTVIKDKTCKPLKSPNMTYTLSNTLKDGVNELVQVEGFITTSVTPIQKTYLNRTYLSEGGTVVDGVVDGILEVCNDYCITYKKFPKGVKEFTKKDVIDSFSFVVTVLSNNVEFTNQTKLSTRKKEYRKYVKEYVKALMLAEISERPKNFDKIIKHLLTVNKANENNDKARAKLNRELTKAITGIGKRPDKLVDCSPKYIGAGKGGEVHICEGDSALGTVIQARHKDNFQAGFPIRGKILNVLKKPLKEVMNNELIKQIFQIIGTGILEDFDMEKRRYDRIILDCDNDTDGFQIRQLVISVLWLLAPQLIKEGMVYICQTPLYEVRCEKNKMLYIYNESEKDKVLSTIEGKYKLSRAKGLGELDAHTMFHCAMNPETRQMIKVTVHDAQEYQQALELWMADEVAPRRDYIMNNLQKYLDGEITLVDRNNAQQLLNHDYMEYSGYCICDRAIVNLYDGLKPVHLRILWTMYNGKMFDFTKCRNVSGATMMYHPHGSCLAGDTKIRLLDNSIRTFKELTEEGKPQWVLSVNEQGNIVPALAHSFRKTKTVNKIINIKLDNGYIIRATEEHEFRLINDTWIQAKDIKAGHIIDYGIVGTEGDREYLTIYGNHTKKTKIHKLVHHSLYGTVEGNEIHHIDHNKTNNTPDNLISLSPMEHHNIHNKNNELSKKGFEKSKYNLFDKNGKYYEKNKEKNRKIIKQINKKQGLVKANYALKKLEERGIELTEINYESMRGEIYNLTKISTLISKGYITDFDDLVTQYKNGIKFVYYTKNKNNEKYIKTEQHKQQCAEGLMKARAIAGLKKLALNHNFSLKDILNCKSYQYIKGVLPLVVDVWVEEVESEDVYDFSVEETHNALICASEDCNTLLVAHNCYPTMVNMIQGDGNNVPFIIGKGSFGMHTSKNLKPADDRYTECHLSDFGRSLFKNLDQIDMVDNYDGKLKIPEVAPVDFPNALCVGTQGIAVGIGAFIPSFNLKEVCQATIDYLQGKEIPLLYPDFPTKGTILPDNKNLLDCNMTGQGRFVIRGNIYTKDKTTLIIDEIPYTTTIEDIISAIENLANKGVHEIKDVVNNTNLEGMSIEITVKANSDKDYLINLIYNNTPLQTTFKSNIGVLYKNKPIYIGVHEVIRKWCEWKQECVKTSLSKKINKTMKDGHLLSAYEKIVDDLDRALDIIRKGEDVITELKNVYGLDEQQAEYIYQSPIGNFNHKKVEKLIAKLNALRKEYKELVETYNSDVAIKQIVIDGLQNTIDKFAIPRNTKIEDFNIEKTEIKVAQKDIAVNSIIVTKEGYVYKTSPKNKDNILLKPSDEVVLSQDGIKDNAELLLFNKKDCNKVPISSIEYTKNNTLGTLTQSNCISALLTENTKYILYVYKEGRVCLVNADSFRTKTQRKKLGNSVCERLTLINVIALEEHQKFTLMGTKGKIKEIDTSEITEKTKRDSQGIRVTKREIVNII